MPHRGDPDLFHDPENVQPLCRACHDRAKQRQERDGFSRRIGEDGWPIDPAHPVNTGRSPERWDASAWVPPDIPRLSIPSVFLCGPPAAGKTTWARERVGPHTLVLDPDVTAASLGLPPAWSTSSPKESGRRIARREMATLRSIDASVSDAIIVRSAPRPITRARWVQALGPRCRLKVLRTPARVCAERIMADAGRRPRAARQLAAVRAWYEADRA